MNNEFAKMRIKDLARMNSNILDEVGRRQVRMFEQTRNLLPVTTSRLLIELNEQTRHHLRLLDPALHDSERIGLGFVIAEQGPSAFVRRFKLSWNSQPDTVKIVPVFPDHRLRPDRLVNIVVANPSQRSLVRQEYYDHPEGFFRRLALLHGQLTWAVPKP